MLNVSQLGIKNPFTSFWFIYSNGIQLIIVCVTESHLCPSVRPFPLFMQYIPQLVKCRSERVWHCFWHNMILDIWNINKSWSYLVSVFMNYAFLVKLKWQFIFIFFVLPGIHQKKNAYKSWVYYLHCMLFLPYF